MEVSSRGKVKFIRQRFIAKLQFNYLRTSAVRIEIKKNALQWTFLINALWSKCVRVRALPGIPNERTPSPLINQPVLTVDKTPPPVGTKKQNYYLKNKRDSCVLLDNTFNYETEAISLSTCIALQR